MINIKELFRKAKVRIVVIFFAMAIIIGVFIGIYRSTSDTDSSGPMRVPSPPSIESVPGKAELSPQYMKTLIKENQQEVQKALATGGSAIPTIVNFDQSTYSPNDNLNQQSCSSFCASLKSCACGA